MRITRRSFALSSSPSSWLTGRDVLWCATGALFTVIVIGPSNPDTATLLLSAVVQNDKATTSTASAVALFDASQSAQDNQGFHLLHIYFGLNDLVTSQIPVQDFWKPTDGGTWTEPGTRKWFSQHGQDVAVMKILDYRRRGFFVDLAANDAVWASNTYTLEQHFAWRGICIEANPIYWQRLAYRHCHAVGAVVGNATPNALVPMVLSVDKVQGPYGGIVGQDFDNKNPKKDIENRYTVPLATLLERFQAPAVIDYLSLDVEGAEWFILQQFPFDKYQFTTLTIERPSEELQALLTQQGYVKVLDIARGDTLWTIKSMADKAQEALKIHPEDIKQHNSPHLPTHAKPQ